MIWFHASVIAGHGGCISSNFWGHGWARMDLGCGTAVTLWTQNDWDLFVCAPTAGQPPMGVYQTVRQISIRETKSLRDTATLVLYYLTSHVIVQINAIASYGIL